MLNTGGSKVYNKNEWGENEDEIIQLGFLVPQIEGLKVINVSKSSIIFPKLVTICKKVSHRVVRLWTILKCYREEEKWDL